MPRAQSARTAVLAIAMLAVLCLQVALAAAPAEAAVVARSANLDLGGLSAFNQASTSRGTLTTDASTAYDGSLSARAAHSGGGDGYQRGVWNVAWQTGDEVWYSAAFRLPVGFKAAMQGQVDLLRWDNWVSHPNDTDWGGLVIYGSDKKMRLMRFNAAGTGTTTLVGPFDVPEDRWVHLEVHQVLGTSTALSEVYLDGALVGRSTAPNTYGRSIERLRVGLVALGGSKQTNPLTLWFDRAAISTTRTGPLGAPPAAVAPAMQAPPAVSGGAAVGATLTGSAGTWSGSPSPATSLQWLRCSSTGAACTAIAGATGLTYVVTSADVGSTLRLRVTATNTAGSASADSAPTAPVPATSTAPANQSPPTISGSVAVGQALTGAAGTWSGNPVPTLTRQWLRCNSTGTACTAITAATGTTYTITTADAGSTLRLRVTATNSAGSATADSIATPAVPQPAAAPSSQSPPTVSGTATAGEVLTGSTGTWTGNPVPTLTRQWLRCTSSGGSCTAISGATGTTLTLGTADVGSTLRLRVTAANSAGSATADSAATAVVAAAPPGPGGPCGSYCTAVMGTSGLRNYWRLNETTGTTAADRTGRTTATYGDGILLGHSGLTTDGDRGVREKTSGGTKYAVTATAPLSLPGAFTLEGWYRLHTPAVSGGWDSYTLLGAYSTFDQGFMLQVLGEPSCSGCWQLALSKNGLGASTAPLPAAGPAGAYTGGARVHIAVTYDGAAYRFYWNGELVGAPVAAAGLADVTGALALGAMGPSLAAWSSGDLELDEVAVYTTALSAATIAAHRGAR